MHQHVDPVVFCGVCNDAVDINGGQFFRIESGNGEENFSILTLSKDGVVSKRITNLKFNSNSKKGCCAFNTACKGCIKFLLQEGILKI